MTSNFSFSNFFFNPLKNFLVIFIKFEIAICKLFQFKSRVLPKIQIHWEKWPTEFEKGGPFQKKWGPGELPIYDANGLSAFGQVGKTKALLDYS